MTLNSLLLAPIQSRAELGEFRVILGPEPTFEQPVSQLATENQFYSPKFQFWCSQLHEPFAFHRKLWEYCYVSQVLEYFDMLKPGKSALGFGVGLEPLPALFASYGVRVMATDQDFKHAQNQGWASTAQYATEKNTLNSRNICDPYQFAQLVDLQTADMNHIDPNLTGYDFVWSCCSLEHLGNLETGLEFIKNSLKCLKPGGIAVHTTEFNLSSYDDTLNSGIVVIYRYQDIFRLAKELTQMGYEVIDLNLNNGLGALDTYYDLPPYKQDPHIKLQINKFICTSIGIIVRKPL